MSRLARYILFCVIATLANLAAQRVVLGLGDETVLWGAILVGTGVGLVVKYLLDKRWIFYDQTTGAAAQGRQFGLYTAMGIVTTAIFWATEAGFWMIWRTDLAREAGAVLGLTIGYSVKYWLDKRFVFVGDSSAP
jgi:putative flippase GtrA